MLETVFLQVLNMSVTGGMVILFVLIARLLLKKAPKLFSYALWSVVLFRLCCPFSFESAISLLPYKTGITPAGVLYTQTPNIDVGIPAVSAAINAAMPVPNLGDSVNPMQIVVAVAAVIWMAGIVALLIYSVVSLLKLRRRLGDAVQESGNIYTSASLNSPFVMGLLRPKIYLPAHLTEEETCYILLHEQTHIKRFDHVVKIVSFFVLCLHWFNPLVWVAFFLCGRDMELSCDEAVIKKLGSDVKKDYSTSLLTLATGRRIVGGTPLAFGEGDTKSRIKNVLNYKKPAFWVIVVSIIAVVAIGIGLMANPKEKPTELGAAQTLWDARTEYVGNNAAVGQLIGLLEFPDSLTYRFFALQTGEDERGVELHLIQDSNRPLTDLETWQLDKNALLLFALIGNLEDVRCSVVDKEGGNVGLHQTRAWADKVVEGDIRDYGESAEKLQELLQLAAEANPMKNRTEAPLNAMRPMIMVDGVLYLDTGKEVAKNVDNSAILGEITSAAGASEKPTKNGQCNFGSGVGAKYAAYDDGIAVFLDHKWFFFEKETDDTAPDVQLENTNYLQSLTDEERKQTEEVVRAYFTDEAPYYEGVVSIEPMPNESVLYQNTGMEAEYAPGNIIIYTLLTGRDLRDNTPERSASVARIAQNAPWKLINQGY